MPPKVAAFTEWAREQRRKGIFVQEVVMRPDQFDGLRDEMCCWLLPPGHPIPEKMKTEITVFGVKIRRAW